MADLNQQLEDVLLALEGYKKVNEPLQLNVETRKELAQIQKWDLEPKAGISAIQEYIRRNMITPDMVRSIDMTLRNDGFLSIILVWGRVYPIIITGPKGDKGDEGKPGPRGFRGLNAKCECYEDVLPSSSSSYLPSSSTSGSSSTSTSEGSSTSGSSGNIEDLYWQLEDGDIWQLENGDYWELEL